MNLPTQHQDVWTQATDADKLKALALLGGLPSRQTSSAEIDEATYYLALDGVTRHGLFEAVKAVHRNALGHPFFPAPSELRGLCDKAMKAHEDMRERAHRQERIRSERPPDRPPLTEAEKQRQHERMAKFHASYSKHDEAAELAAIRAKYDPELMAKVPDAPLPSNWKRTA
jgi:hypothetical protein